VPCTAQLMPINTYPPCPPTLTSALWLRMALTRGFKLSPLTEHSLSSRDWRPRMAFTPFSTILGGRGVQAGRQEGWYLSGARGCAQSWNSCMHVQL
jgi:hypothetical protein